MPVLRRSIVNSLTKQHQQQHVDAGATSTGEGPAIEEVFVIEETGELCASYEYVNTALIIVWFPFL